MFREVIPQTKTLTEVTTSNLTINLTLLITEVYVL